MSLRLNMLSLLKGSGLRQITSLHYAWIIVVIAATMRLVTTAFRMSATVLVPHMANTFGWSYGAIGLGFSIQWVLSGLLGPVAGWLGDRYGVRRTMLVGVFLFIAGMLLTGYVTRLWQFYLTFGIVLSGAMAVFQVPLVAAVTLWFKKHLGVGMGILQSSQGFGPVIFAPLILLVLNRYGWSWALWLPGLVGGAVLLLMVRFFHNEPGEIGLRPYGASQDEPIQRLQRGPIAKARTEAFLEQVRRTGTFWNLIGIHFWGCAGHNIILIFLVAIAVERGVPAVAAAGALGTLALSSTITRFAVPIAADRFGSKGVMAVCFFLQVTPILILFGANETWMFYLFAVLFGVGFGGEMSAFPIINRQYYGSAPIGTTYGWQMLGAGMGMAAGALIGGVLRDQTGNYDYMLALSMVLSLIGTASIFFLPTTRQRQVPRWEESLPPEARSQQVGGTA